MSKSLDELKNEKLRELSSGFDHNNNINVFSKWSYEEGWKDAIEAMSEREKKLAKYSREIVIEIYQSSIIDYMNEASSFSKVFNRRLKALEKALKEYGG